MDELVEEGLIEDVVKGLHINPYNGAELNGTKTSKSLGEFKTQCLEC